MKKGTKIFLIIFVILLIVIFVDTIQSKIFNNNPLIKNTENYNSSNVYKRDSGNFSLVFYQKTAIKPKQEEIIISKGEIKNIDYDIYAFEGHVAINYGDSTELTESSISLRDALLQNQITMEEIIEKAKKDCPDALSYDDGGSMEYHYPNYTIVKCNRLDGNKDVYIGPKDMTINDLDLKERKIF